MNMSPVKKHESFHLRVMQLKLKKLQAQANKLSAKGKWENPAHKEAQELELQIQGLQRRLNWL
jgi:hypothetical protein